MHGGLHAIDRHAKGYPIQILEEALKASNGVIAVFASILADQPQFTKDVYKSFVKFSDCFQTKGEVVL